MKRQLAEAWGQFLSEFDWDWFVTLTFRDEIKSFSAHRYFERFARDIEKQAAQPIFWFRADEEGSRLGRFHIHALFGNVAHLRRLYWMDVWSERAGYARILEFQKMKGGAYYCAKYVTKELSDWEMSSNITAFRQYQSTLALHGPTKLPSVHPTKDVPAKTEVLRTGHVQERFPDMLAKDEPSVEPATWEVYKDEVTRRRGRFKNFFTPGTDPRK
jgi:hypothetical protein